MPKAREPEPVMEQGRAPVPVVASPAVRDGHLAAAGRIDRG